MTLNDIMTENLKGKIITVYEYNAELIHTKSNGRHSNFFLSDKDEEINRNYDRGFKELKITKHMPYEGTSLHMKLNIDGKDAWVNTIHCESNLELE